MSWQPEVDELRRREALAREMGGPRRSRASATAASSPCASASTRCSIPARSTRSARISRQGDATTTARWLDAHAGELRHGPRRASTAGPSSSAATTSPCAAAPPTRRSARSRCTPSGWRTSCGCRSCAWSTAPAAAARCKTLETERPHVRAVQPGLGVGGRRTSRPCPVVAPRLGPVAGLGAARVVTSHYSRDGQGHVAAVRRRTAGGRAQLGETVDKEELGGSQIHTPQRRGRRRGRRARPRRSRARGASSRTCRRRCTSCRRARRATTIPNRRDDWLIDAIPRDRRKVYKMRPIIERVVDRGSCASRSARGSGRSRSPGSRASTAGRSRCWPAIRTSTAAAGRPTRREKVDALRRPRRDVPPAGRAPRRQPGLRHRHAGGAGGDDPPRRPRARRGVPGERAVVLDHRCARCYGVAGAAHTRTQRARVSATRGRRATGARCRSRAASRPRTRPSSRRRDDPAALRAEIERAARTPCARRSAPPRRSCIEEIIDPRDTRPLLCEFANLAAPLRAVRAAAAFLIDREARAAPSAAIADARRTCLPREQAETLAGNKIAD